MGLPPVRSDTDVYLEAHPEMQRATYRVPRDGVTGTAANLVLHVARRAGARR